MLASNSTEYLFSPSLLPMKLFFLSDLEYDISANMSTGRLVLGHTCSVLGVSSWT